MNEFITEGSLPKGMKVYFKCRTDQAGVVVEKKIYKGGIRFIDMDDGKDFVIYDNDDRILVKPTIYIQDLRANKPHSTRRQMGIAISLLYVFGELFHVNPEHMTSADVERFKQFLMGTNVRPEPGCQVTRRSPHTVNVYLGYIRKYLETNDIFMGGFKLSTPASVRVPRITDDHGTVVPGKKKFRSEPTDPKRKYRLPKHIRPFEMQQILKKMKEKKDILGLCLCILLYGYGLRIGEALGLTTEDLQREELDGKVRCHIILRNRISDHQDQSCKRLYHPKHVTEYKASYWQDSYWEIPIEERHYNLLKQYYMESRDVNAIRRKHKGKDRANEVIRTINTDTVADSVENNGLNHYLFIAENGKRLSLQTWNYRLKKYFEEVGMTPDHGKRFLNASHRLRHGFAMWHAHYCETPVTVLQLAKMMRHTSVSSTAIYYTLTEEDEMKYRSQHNNELHELIPEF